MQPYDAPAAYPPPVHGSSVTPPPQAYRTDPFGRGPPSRRRGFETRPAADLPSGAKILAALFVLGALLCALVGISHLAAADAFDDARDDRNDAVGDGDDGVRDGVGSGLALLALAVASAAVAFGFMTGQTWAWFAGLAVAFVALCVCLYGIFRGTNTVIAVLGLLLSAVAIAAHFMPRVQTYYGGRRSLVAHRY